MKSFIISCPGGSGSTFIIDSFRKVGLTTIRPDGYNIKKNKVKKSSDTFDFNSSYVRRKVDLIKVPKNEKQAIELIKQKIEKKERIGKTLNFVFMTWGGRGFLDEFFETIWVIRDPLQVYTSITRKRMHGSNFVGYINVNHDYDYVNDRRCIDAWLFGPLQYYCGHYKRALKSDRLVRYENFIKDFKKYTDNQKLIEYMSARFKKSEKNISEYLTVKSQTYIKEKLGIK